MASSPVDFSFYRQGVGMILLNHERKVFVGQRTDVPLPAWQMPQGGIDEGETPLQAMYREMQEEVGTDRFTVLQESEQWFFYDFPPFLQKKFNPNKGQRQKWFLLSFSGCDTDICIKTPHPEFQDWKWVEPEILVDLVISFKKDLYQSVLKNFSSFFMNPL